MRSGSRGCTRTSSCRRTFRSSATPRATPCGCSTTQAPVAIRSPGVVDRLRAEPGCRSATVTTFQPLTDTTYIPCVSLLDFWLPGGAVELVAYCHSIDFGAKGYGNLVELAVVQEQVAAGLGCRVGRL